MKSPKELHWKHGLRSIMRRTKNIKPMQSQALRVNVQINAVKFKAKAKHDLKEKISFMHYQKFPKTQQNKQ